MRQFKNWHSLHAPALDTATCDEREMDKALSRDLQHLFENSGARSSAANVLCAAQHYIPRLREGTCRSAGARFGLGRTLAPGSVGSRGLPS